MGWSPRISSADVVAIHAALIPTSNGDGEILLFGGDNHDHAEARAGHFDHSRRFNCRAPLTPLIEVNSPSFDLFCCGHAFLGDGRLLVSGGTARFPAEAGPVHSPHQHFDGHSHCAAYQPWSGTFTAIPDMRAGGRWYPTLCTLGTGEVLAFHSHPGEDDTVRHNNNTPERFNPISIIWNVLPAIGADSVPVEYSRLHLVNDGRIFCSSRTSHARPKWLPLCASCSRDSGQSEISRYK